MLTKNLKLAVILLAAAFTSCSQQEDGLTPSGQGDGKEITTTISVSVPEVFKSRSVPDVYGDDAYSYFGESGKSSMGNFDLRDNKLTYTVGVYIDKVESDGTVNHVLVDQQCKKNITDANAYFEFHLMRGETYRVVAYADYNELERNLDNIPINPVLNKEQADAFFVSEEFEAREEMEITLRRPFGKLRLIAHDFSTFAKGEVFKIKSVKVTYNSEKAEALRTSQFNAITGEFNVETDNTKYTNEFTAPSVSYAEEHEVDPETGENKKDYAAVFTMYLPVNRGSLPNDESGNPVLQEWMYPFDVEVTYNNGEKDVTIVRPFDFDIPVKRNWLTTVDVAEFWAGISGIEVTIDHLFEGEINVNTPPTATVKSAAELQKEIDNILNKAPIDGRPYVGNIVLGNTINVSENGGCIYIDTYPNDLKKKVEIHLDLNGHKITSDGSKLPGGAKGVLSIYSRNIVLYIDDNTPDAKGRIEYTGSPENGYPLVTCSFGGQVVINRGNFVSTSPREVIWVNEMESDRAKTQGLALNAIGLYPSTAAQFPEKPTDPDQLAKIKAVVDQLTSTATINGGWFENGFTGSVDDPKNVLINTQNARRGDAYWGKYSHYLQDKGYPAWTNWGPYVNQTFSFMYINDGSFVNFDPSKGDNIVGNQPHKWIGEGHVEIETVDEKTVYTVVPVDDPFEP